MGGNAEESFWPVAFVSVHERGGKHILRRKVLWVNGISFRCPFLSGTDNIISITGTLCQI